MVYLEQGDDAPHLSMRERQILERVALGRSAKEVAIELGIAHRTVERHIENARNKMRARNKTHMITKAVICGELVLAAGFPTTTSAILPARLPVHGRPSADQHVMNWLQASNPGGIVMGSKSKAASLAALLISTAIPITILRGPSQRRPRSTQLQAELTALKLEQQSTDRRIEALEQRLIDLGGSPALNSGSRVADENAALMRGRGLGGEPNSQPPPRLTAADDETRKEPAKSAAVEAVTRDQQGYFGHAFTIEPGVSYSHFSTAQLNLNGFLALDAIFLGLISIDQTNADVDRVGHHRTLRHRAPSGRREHSVPVPQLQLPVGRSRRQCIRAHREDHHEPRPRRRQRRPQLPAWSRKRPRGRTSSVNVRGKAPTGRDPFGVELIEVENARAISRSPRACRPVRSVGSSGRDVGAEDHRPDGRLRQLHLFPQLQEPLPGPRRGDQRPTRRGSPRRCVPVRARRGFRAERPVLAQYLLHAAVRPPFEAALRIRRIRTSIQPWQTVVGSEANVGALNLGATFSLSDRLTLLTNLAVGITQDAPDMTFMVQIPYQF